MPGASDTAIMTTAIARGLRPRHVSARRLLSSLWASLPKGRSLPDDVWRRRHRGILVLLWLQALVIGLMVIVEGYGPAHGLTDALPVALAGAVAGAPALPRRWRACIASLGLITASAGFVHLSGGNIESHFHFFVMVTIIILYEDWIPFLIAIGEVVLHHGIMGVLTPRAVYNHADAWAHPWKWAAIHGGFVLAASARTSSSGARWNAPAAVRS
jgi:hypothetical protein